jgi:hypothetical protein
VFKLALTHLNKAFVGAKLKFVGFDYGIFGFSHCVTFSINVVHWRDLVKGSNLSSGRFSYTSIGQPVKQRNSDGNALRTREIILRSSISIPLRFIAEGGGSFPATP